MYQALYRKWRPRVFADVIGQEHVTRTLRTQVAAGRTSHAYLFTGTRGTGKTTCAKILSRAVNCEHPNDGDPCCECDACRGLEEGRYLDVLELDAASNNGVDQVRALRDEAVYAPASVKKRVYIVDEVHMLSTPAFNALLKILEEPPEHLMFILATTELHKVPATILSRCQRYAFRRIRPEDVEARLNYVAAQEGIDLTADGAELLSRLADGALRDGLSLLDQCAAAGGTVDSAAVLETLGLAGRLRTADLLEHILRRDAAAALSLLGELYDGGKDVGSLLGELSGLVRDLLLLKTAPKGGAALLSGGYDAATLDRLGKQAGGSRLLYLASTLQKAGAELYASANRRTDAELCVLRLCDETLSGGMEALASRVEALEASHAAGVPMQAAPVQATPMQAAPVRTASVGTPAPPVSARPEPRRAAVQTAPPPISEEPPPPDAPPWLDEPPPERESAPPWDDAPPERVPPAPPTQRAAPVREAVPAVRAPDAPAALKPSIPTVPPPAPPSDPDAPKAAAPTGGPLDWTALVERCKPRLPVFMRPFLGSCTGVLEDGLLTVCAPEAITISRLDNDRVRGVLLEESGADRIVFREGTPPARSPEENRRELVELCGKYDSIQITGGPESP